MQNVKADALLRKFNDTTEWTLSTEVYRKLCLCFGEPVRDLFASHLNYKQKPYFSWGPDPEAAEVDAFTCSWEGGMYYVFPPFALIGRVLQKVVQEEAEVLLVAP